MNKIIVMLTIFMTLIFSTAVLGGGYLTYWQLSNELESNSDKPVSSDVTIESRKDAKKIEITNALPGLIIFIFGAVGLILLLFKVPIQEVMKNPPIDRGYGSEGTKWSSGRQLDYSTPGVNEYNEQVSNRLKPYMKLERKYNASLPVWWVLKLTNHHLKRTDA